jgi:hypothetical protein
LPCFSTAALADGHHRDSRPRQLGPRPFFSAISDPFVGGRSGPAVDVGSFRLVSHEPRSYRDDRERNRNAKGSHQSFPGRLHSASEHACSASSAGFIHSSAKTRHVTLRTSSTAACARCRHFSAERRQCAGKFSVSWPALTGPSRRRWLARRNRRLLWPSLALWPGTCGSVRALF